MAIQTTVGYFSAALGLACELVIAARFGASATTDVYRWAGLLPFYANTLFGGILIPIYLRSRLFPRAVDRIHVLKLAKDGTYIYPNVLVVSAGTLAVVITVATPLGMTYMVKLAVYVQSGLLACALSLYAIMMAPLFYKGWIWVNVGATALSNFVLFLFLLSPLRNLYSIIIIGMGVTGLCLLAIPWLAVRSIDTAVVAALKESAAQGRAFSLKGIAIVAFSGVASAISTTTYFSALASTGPGLVSLYTTTQKAGLILAVPANAILNKFIRDDFLSGRHATVVSRAVQAVIPILAISPLFVIGSFSLLCAMYSVSPTSAEGRLLAAGCGASAALVALNSCWAMLTVARHSSRHTLIPSLLSIVVAGLGAAVILLLGRSEWTISVPIFGSALASVAALSWVSRRLQQGLLSVWLLTIGCVIVAAIMIIVLPREPVVQIIELIVRLLQIFIHKSS